jgi:hypothetical protein
MLGRKLTRGDHLSVARAGERVEGCVLCAISASELGWASVWAGLVACANGPLAGHGWWTSLASWGGELGWSGLD